MYNLTNFSMEPPSQTTTSIDVEATITETIDAMNCRYYRLFVWYFILMVVGVVVLELYKREKIHEDKFYTYMRALQLGHVGTSIMLLFPLFL